MSIISQLLLRNLHEVFEEANPQRRMAVIQEIFHEDAIFYEPQRNTTVVMKLIAPVVFLNSRAK